MAEMIYLNGSMVPRDEARISVFDHGFRYGYGLFETMRAYNGKIFLLDSHIIAIGNSILTISKNRFNANITTFINIGCFIINIIFCSINSTIPAIVIITPSIP